MGCIASTRRFFPDGRLNRKRWQQGQLELTLQLQQFTAAYHALGWREVIGSSVTDKAIAEMQASPDLPAGTITGAGLEQAVDALLKFKHIDDIKLPGISSDRRPVIAGGLLVMDTCFRALGLSQMRVCETAMREGVLYDMLGRTQQRDPRDAAIAALVLRYGMDTEHAARIEHTALQMFDEVAESWELDPDDRLMLGWAARRTNWGWRSRTASTRSTAPTSLPIPTSTVSRARNRPYWRPWCAASGAASTRTCSAPCPAAWRRPRCAISCCCAWRSCCTAATTTIRCRPCGCRRTKTASSWRCRATGSTSMR